MFTLIAYTDNDFQSFNQLTKDQLIEHWSKILAVKIDYDEDTSQALSMLRYRECVIDRLGYKGKEIFDDIISSMKLRF